MISARAIGLGALFALWFHAAFAQTARNDPDQARKSEATVLLSNVLSAAQIQGSQIIEMDNLAIDLSAFFDAVWATQGGLTGSAKIIEPTAGRTAHDVASYVIADCAQRCNGLFATGRFPSGPKDAFVRLKTGCSSKDGTSASDYTIAPRASGGFVIFSVTAANEGASTRSEEAGARIHQAAMAVLARARN
jgi:hypothetical protein